MRHQLPPPASFILLILLFIFSISAGAATFEVSNLNNSPDLLRQTRMVNYTNLQSNEITPGGMLYIQPVWPELPLNQSIGFYNYDVDLKINEDPGENSSYFWANQFHFLDGDGGYIGLQTNGFMQGRWVGKMAIFSIWQALEAIPGSNSSCEWFGHEGEGLSCRIPYEWQKGHTYKLRVWVLDTDSSGNEWWGAWIGDELTNESIYLGKILVPASWQWLDWSIAWVEYYGLVSSCQDIPYTHATFSSFNANVNIDVAEYNPVDFILSYAEGNCIGQKGESIVISTKPIEVSFVTGGKKLSISKPGSGYGTVISNPDGINCSVTCTMNFNSNTQVTLTAIPDTGYSFSGWSGDCSGTATSCTLTMDADKSVTALFANVAPTTFPLTTATTGTGSGTVGGAGNYAAGTTVSLTATPNADSTFIGWSPSPCAASFTMPTNDLTCTATFNSEPPAGQVIRQ